MEESSTEQCEGETGTGGISTQAAGVTGMFATVITVVFLQTHHTIFTQDLYQLVSLLLLPGV